MYGQKKCRRRACDTVIHGRSRSEHRRRKYCSNRCNVLANAARCKRGMNDFILRRDCREVQAALGVSSRQPPLALVRALRRFASGPTKRAGTS